MVPYHQQCFRGLLDLPINSSEAPDGEGELDDHHDYSEAHEEASDYLMVLHKQLLLLFVNEVGVVLDLGHAHQISNLGLVGILTTVTVFFFDLI